ncbi:hypothetical protein AMTRI_Chr08g167320 [Amborella trichopoda]
MPKAKSAKRKASTEEETRASIISKDGGISSLMHNQASFEEEGNMALTVDEYVMILFLSTISVDLSIRILLALPVESIFRFKCACKSWQQLLSSVLFAQIHSLCPTLPSEVFAFIYVDDYLVPSSYFSLLISKNSVQKNITSQVQLIEVPSRFRRLQCVAFSHGLVCYRTW